MRNLYSFEVSFQKIIINYKGENCKFTRDKPGRYPLDQVISYNHQ